YKVIQQCTQNSENWQQPKPIFYQKQMTKHMIPSIKRDWIDQVCNVFLLRDPAKVIASYHIKEEDPEMSDIGLEEQFELFDSICQKTGSAPAVIDSWDILNAPEKMLKALCKAIDIEFEESMLSWQAGPKSYDGIWAPHWYKSVWNSTGFAKPSTKKTQVPDHLMNLLDSAKPYYDKLKEYKIS
ncbi:MAG: HAD family hydrolase, partial [Kangiellaceae bacterium]